MKNACGDIGDDVQLWLGADARLPAQTLPLVAFHPIIGKKGSKLWLAMQAPLFFAGVITSLVAFAWQARSAHPQPPPNSTATTTTARAPASSPPRSRSRPHR